MTHGQNYLFENLPYTQKKISVTTLSETKRSNNDSLFVYEDLIHPVLEEKCIACHNQNRASGAINFEIAGFCSLGIFGILGIWTKLKYHNKPIHITPERTCIHLKKKDRYE